MARSLFERLVLAGLAAAKLKRAAFLAPKRASGEVLWRMGKAGTVVDTRC